MTCTGFVYEGDYKIVHKELGDGTDIDVQAYERINDLEGYLILSNSTMESQYNYFLIPVDGKDKYFMVTSKEMMTGGRCRVNVYQDVLKTWETEIDEFICIVESTVDDRSYTKDAPGSFPLYQYTKTAQEAYIDLDYSQGSGADKKWHYILVTVGKGGDESAQEEAIRIQEEQKRQAEELLGSAPYNWLGG